jgi:hypothetical protein
MVENCNGFNNRIGGNEKIAKAFDIKEDFDTNYLMYCKHCINFRDKDNKNDLNQMFQCELACTEVSAHNVHKAKCAGRVQEGGTGTICFGYLVGYIKKTGRDDKGLGMWCWVLLGGNNGHNMQIITAYNPCKNINVTGDIIPTAVLVLHNKKKHHLPLHFVLQTPSQTGQAMVSIRGQDNPIYGPQ